MKSQKLILCSYGKAHDSVKLVDFTIPKLALGEILLKIHASPINPADINWIEGSYGIKTSLPAVAGTECVATVIESRSRDFAVGQCVMAVKRIGCWAKHALVKADDIIPIPAGIDACQAAMLKVNPLTAWLLLNSFEKLHPGDCVVFNAAHSGVGQCIIQLAASLEIRSLCFVRNENQANALTSLGATRVFFDSSEGYHLAREYLGTQSPRLAFNAVGGESALRLMKLLAPSASLITYGAMSKKPLTIPNGLLIFSDLQIRGLWVTRWLQDHSRNEILEVYAELATRMAAGKLTQVIDSTYSLSDFPEAFARLEHPDRNGKVIFKC